MYRLLLICDDDSTSPVRAVLAAGADFLIFSTTNLRQLASAFSFAGLDAIIIEPPALLASETLLADAHAQDSAPLLLAAVPDSPSRTREELLHRGFDAVITFGQLTLEDLLTRLTHAHDLRALGRHSSLLRQALPEVAWRSPDGVLIISGDQRIRLINPAGEAMFGHAAGSLIGRPLVALVPERFRATHEVMVRRFRWGAADSRQMAWRNGITGLHADGHEFPIEVSLTRLEVAGHLLMAAFIRDISVRMAAQESLYRQATRDFLTGLANRAALMDALNLELRRGDSLHRPTSVIMIDIDHFKLVNDRFGHLVGDEVLCSIARHLEQGIRAVDIASRYGGEEFLILLPETTLEAAYQVAERLRRTIGAAEHATARGGLRCTVSAGVAVARGRCTALELLHQADMALYLAKESGRDRVAIKGENLLPVFG